jgi:hypothetical protein
MFAVKEVSRVSWVKSKSLKAREGLEQGRGPFPAIPELALNSKRALV